jgi:hypothetical protein
LELCLESIKNLLMEPQDTSQMELTSGILYLANDKPRKAADTFQHSLQTARTNGDGARESVLYAYLGTAYALLRKKEEAHKAFEDSLSRVVRMKGETSDLLEELMLMADLAHESNEHVAEKSFLQVALSMADGMADEIKIKQQISLMIEAAEAQAAVSQPN